MHGIKLQEAISCKYVFVPLLLERWRINSKQVLRNLQMKLNNDECNNISENRLLHPVFHGNPYLDHM